MSPVLSDKEKQTTSKEQKYPRKKKVFILNMWAIRTVLFWSSYCFCKFSAGVAIAIFGPTIAYLSANSHASIQQLGMVFGLASVGEIISAVICGVVFDKVRNAHRLIASMACVLALAMCLIPYATSFALLTVIWTMSVLTRPFLIFSLNILIIWKVGNDCSAKLNVVAGFFGLGSIFAPTLANIVSRFDAPEAAFWGIAGLASLCALMLLLMPCPRNPLGDAKGQEIEMTNVDETEVTDGTEANDETLPDIMQWGIVLMCALNMGVFTAMEISFGQLLNLVARVGYEMPLDPTSILNSTYWALFTLTRLVLLPFLFKLFPKFMTPSNVLFLFSILNVTGCIINLLAPSVTTLWICSVSIAIGTAPAFGTSIAAAQRWVPLNGKKQSSFSVCAATGAGLGTFLGSTVIGNFGVRALTKFELGVGLLAVAISVVMIYVDRRLLKKNQTSNYMNI